MDTRKKIESFRYIQTLYQTTGFYTPEEKQYCSLNKKVFRISLSFIPLFLLSFAYVLFEAKDIGDMAYSYCLSLCFLWATFLFPLYSMKIPNTLQLIENIDEFIRKSKMEFISILTVLATDMQVNTYFINDRIIESGIERCSQVR